MLIVYRESHIFHNQYSQNDKIVKLGSPQPWTTRNKSKLQKIFDQEQLCLFFLGIYKFHGFKSWERELYILSPSGFMSKCNYKSFVIVTRSAKKRQTCCHNKIPTGIFFHWNCAFDRKNEIWKKLWEKYFLQSALAEMCQLSHKKAFSFGLASL